MTPTPGYIQATCRHERRPRHARGAVAGDGVRAGIGDGDRAQGAFRPAQPDQSHAQRRRHPPLSHRTARRRRRRLFAAAAYRPRRLDLYMACCMSWMYRVGVASILGLRIENGALHVNPCIPRSWQGFEMTYRAPRAEYRISVENRDGVSHGVLRVGAGRRGARRRRNPHRRGRRRAPRARGDGRGTERERRVVSAARGGFQPPSRARCRERGRACLQGARQVRTSGAHVEVRCAVTHAHGSIQSLIFNHPIINDRQASPASAA